MEMFNHKPKLNLPVYCESCKTSFTTSNEFRKLLNLSDSGLVVYINANGKMPTNRKESVILHNAGGKVLKKADYFAELSRYKTKCFLCNALVQRVCNLISEVTEIKENEMIAVCEHCKRTKAANNCKRCDDIVKTFLNNEINQYKYRHQALKVRLYEVRRILSFIVDRKNLCDHRICQAYYDSNAELKILLELIKSPLPSKRDEIEEYFSLMETDNDSRSKKIDDRLYLKSSGLRCESNESLISSASLSESFCICRYLKARNFESSKPLTFSPPEKREKGEEEPSSQSPKYHTTSTNDNTRSILKDITEKISNESQTKLNKKLGKIADVKMKGNVKKTKTDKENIPSGEKKTKSKKYESKDASKDNMIKSTKKDKEKDKGKQQKSENDIMQLIKGNKDKKQKEKQTTVKKVIPVIPKISDLPEIRHIEQEEIVREDSGVIIECDPKEPSHPTEMVHGNRIVPYHGHIHTCHDKEPLIFKVKHEFISDENTLSTPTNTTTTTISTTTGGKKIKKLKTKVHSSADTKLDGILKYELSNRKYIENGWTKLPSIKVVRKMNVYKMIAAYPQFDWFAHHEKHHFLSYNSGEILAEVDEDGSGRWFYRNGRVALEYYKTKEMKSGLKYVVYDHGDIVEGRKIRPNKILASFDHLGNGVIYDDVGKVRLKYNQSEGLVIDKKIGPPGRWKWHTLNDPPVLQQVYIDTVEESDQCFQEVVKQHINDSDLTKRAINESLIAIEFENFVKDRAKKMLQSFKPFEIRMKAFKINNYFSIRIIDQANIQLLFRCSHVSLKVNMGMLLISNEIIDVIVSDVSDVATPFDRPLSSNSVKSI